MPETTLRCRDHRVVPHSGTDRCALADVADNRRGGVCVDVSDVGGGDSRPPDGVLHRLDLAETIRMVPGDVVGVRGDAVPGEAAVDLGAACFGVVSTLQDDRPGALTEHATVAIGTKGPGSRTRCIVTRGNGACLGESRERDGVDACFGTTRDDNVRTV